MKENSDRLRKRADRKGRRMQVELQDLLVIRKRVEDQLEELD